MMEYTKFFLSSEGIYLILGQRGMERSYEFVHSYAHGFPVRETCLPFLVVVGIEDGVVALAAVSHPVQVFAQHCISPFGYLQVLAGVFRFVAALVSVCEGDELLVSGELGDIRNLGKKRGSRHFSDTGDGCQDSHLASVQGLLDFHQGLDELLIAREIRNQGQTLMEVQRLNSHEVLCPRNYIIKNQLPFVGIR